MHVIFPTCYRKGRYQHPFYQQFSTGSQVLAHYFQNCLCVFDLKKVFVLLRFSPCFCLQECYEVVLKTLFENSVSVKKFCFKQVPTSIYLLEKENVSVLVSFRQCYPTISEQVASLLEFEGQFERDVRPLKQCQDVLVITLMSQIIYLRQQYPRQPF